MARRTHRQRFELLSAPMPVVESMTVDLGANAETVFAFMWDPASSLVLEDGVLQAMTLPGTPQGEVGEIQVTVREQDGQLVGTMLEVLEVVAGRRAVTRNMTTDFESRQVLQVDPLTDTTCRLTQHFGDTLPAGVHAGAADELRRGQRKDLAKLRERLVRRFGAPAPG